MTVYGIKNCDKVKSAMEWLRKNKIDFEFHDYKVKGIENERLKSWCGQVGWESLVNKRGTTWRMLTEDEQLKVKNEKSAITLMVSKTSIIKRPVLEEDERVIVLGFDKEEYVSIFKK